MPCVYRFQCTNQKKRQAFLSINKLNFFFIHQEENYLTTSKREHMLLNVFSEKSPFFLVFFGIEYVCD